MSSLIWGHSWPRRLLQWSPSPKKVGVTRLRGRIEKPLTIPTPTELILVQRWGNSVPEVRGAGSPDIPPTLLVAGTSVRVTKDVTAFVPEGVTIDLLYIAGV